MMKTIHSVILVAAFTILCSGCNSINKSKMQNPITKLTSGGDQTEYAEPYRVVAVWKDAVATNTKGESMRGFAGRVFFLDKEEKITPVIGEVTVYGFDDSPSAEKTNEPNQRIVYSPEQLENLRSGSKVGEAYSLWVPWDKDISGYQKDISLLTVFKTKSGRVVRGELVKASLPGDTDPSLEARSEFINHFRKSLESSQGIEQVQHIEQQLKDKRNRSMETTTINLSGNLRERLNQMTESGVLSIQQNQTIQNQSNALENNSSNTTSGGIISTDSPEVNVNNLDINQPPATQIEKPLTPMVEDLEESQSNFRRVPMKPIGSSFRK